MSVPIDDPSAGGPAVELSDRFYRELHLNHANLLAYASRLIPAHVRSTIDPSDVVQDAIERAVRRLRTFEWREENSAELWLKTIIRNLIIDASKKSQPSLLTHTRDQDTSLEAELADLATTSNTPSRSAVRRERVARLATAVNALPEPYRTIVRLRHVEQLAAADVARQTQKSLDSVNKTCSRGVNMLREMLADA